MSSARLVRHVVVAAVLAILAVLGVAPVQADVQPRIVNGEPTTAQEHPYLVSLGYLPDVLSEGWVWGHTCGGTLIAADLVLTAAHCVQERQTGLAHPGLLIVGRPDSSGLLSNITDERSIASIHVHPRWNSANAMYDAAILRLASPFTDAKVLAPAGHAESWTGLDTAQVVGWGVTQVGNSSPSSRLMAGSVQRIPDDACGTDGWHEVGGLSFQGLEDEFIPESMLCAVGVSRGEAVDTCSGDSGGPLITGTGPSARLTGITSWGRSCAKSWPGVYTRVTALVDWIADVVSRPLAESSSIDAPRVVKVHRVRGGVRLQVSSVVPVEAVLLHRLGVQACLLSPKRPACTVPFYGGRVGKLSVTLTTRPNANTTQSLAAWTGLVR